jgi:hypothetical protein
MTQMLKHPASISRTHLQNEARQRHIQNTEIHEQLLTHAVHCQEVVCGYPTCHLMRVRIVTELLYVACLLVPERDGVSEVRCDQHRMVDLKISPLLAELPAPSGPAPS